MSLQGTFHPQYMKPTAHTSPSMAAERKTCRETSSVRDRIPQSAPDSLHSRQVQAYQLALIPMITLVKPLETLSHLQ